MSGSIRIIAGEYGGRRIEVPERGTRPLADRVRQSLFAILEPRLPGARVLDLCAGSGAAGFEALSRGAATVIFVERSRDAAEVIRRNAALLGCGGASTVRVADAASAAEGVGDDAARFDVIVFDPPYEDVALRRAVLMALAAPDSILAPRGLLVATRRRVRGDGAESPPLGLRLVRSLDFGETEVVLLERSARDGESRGKERE